jgi:hypothetical protein
MKKVAPQNWAISVIYKKKLPEANNCPIGGKFAQSGHPVRCAKHSGQLIFDLNVLLTWQRTWVRKNTP